MIEFWWITVKEKIHVNHLLGLKRVKKGGTCNNFFCLMVSTIIISFDLMWFSSPKVGFIVKSLVVPSSLKKKKKYMTLSEQVQGLYHALWTRPSCSAVGYRIYSINRPGGLLNFWTLGVGAYLRWALIQGWTLIKFSPFSASQVCVFCNKTINANNKTQRSNKVKFL